MFDCRRPSATLRQRLLGNSSNNVGSKSSSRPGDKTELSKLWQQLKDDIESAMARKPVSSSDVRDQGTQERGQYKRFSVIRRQVGEQDLHLITYDQLHPISYLFTVKIA